jgi:hypothetical protein
MKIIVIGLALLLAGCAGSGPIYWVRPGSGFDDFSPDHRVCMETYSQTAS